MDRYEELLKHIKSIAPDYEYDSKVLKDRLQDADFSKKLYSWLDGARKDSVPGLSSYDLDKNKDLFFVQDGLKKNKPVTDNPIQFVGGNAGDALIDRNPNGLGAFQQKPVEQNKFKDLTPKQNLQDNARVVTSKRPTKLENPKPYTDLDYALDNLEKGAQDLSQANKEFQNMRPPLSNNLTPPEVVEEYNNAKKSLEEKKAAYEKLWDTKGKQYIESAVSDALDSSPNLFINEDYTLNIDNARKFAEAFAPNKRAVQDRIMSELSNGIGAWMFKDEYKKELKKRGISEKPLEEATVVKSFKDIQQEGYSLNKKIGTYTNKVKKATDELQAKYDLEASTLIKDYDSKANELQGDQEALGVLSKERDSALDDITKRRMNDVMGMQKVYNTEYLNILAKRESLEKKWNELKTIVEKEPLRGEAMKAAKEMADKKLKDVNDVKGLGDVVLSYTTNGAGALLAKHFISSLATTMAQLESGFEQQYYTNDRTTAYKDFWANIAQKTSSGTQTFEWKDILNPTKFTAKIGDALGMMAPYTLMAYATKRAKLPMPIQAGASWLTGTAQFTGSAYDDALRNGDSPLKAKEKANEVFKYRLLELPLEFIHIKTLLGGLVKSPSTLKNVAGNLAIAQLEGTARLGYMNIYMDAIQKDRSFFNSWDEWKTNKEVGSSISHLFLENLPFTLMPSTFVGASAEAKAERRRQDYVRLGYLADKKPGIIQQALYNSLFKGKESTLLAAEFADKTGMTTEVVNGSLAETMNTLKTNFDQAQSLGLSKDQSMRFLDLSIQESEANKKLAAADSPEKKQAAEKEVAAAKAELAQFMNTRTGNYVVFRDTSGDVYTMSIADAREALDKPELANDVKLGKLTVEVKHTGEKQSLDLIEKVRELNPTKVQDFTYANEEVEAVALAKELSVESPKVSDLLNTDATLTMFGNEVKGRLVRDGRSLIFQTGNVEYSLGNFESLRDLPVDKIGIMVDQRAVDVNTREVFDLLKKYDGKINPERLVNLLTYATGADRKIISALVYANEVVKTNVREGVEFSDQDRAVLDQASAFIGRNKEDHKPLVEAVAEKVGKVFEKAGRGQRVSYDQNEFDSYLKSIGRDPADPKWAIKGARDPKTNTIFLNPREMTKDVPIHEFKHVWVDMLKDLAPELYNRGRELIKGTEWEKSAIDNEYEDPQEEALVQYLGEIGTKYFENKYLSPTDKSFWTKILDAIKSWFPNSRGKDVSKWTLQDIADFTNETIYDKEDIGSALKVAAPAGVIKSGEPQFSTERRDEGFFRTKDDKPIGYSYDTDMVARERFNIPALTKIGAGSDRVVFDLGDKVLKIAKTPRGLEQNVHEGDWYLASSGIIPKIFERGLNYVVVEKVEPIDKKTNPEAYKIVKQMLNEFQQFDIHDYKTRRHRDHQLNKRINEVLTKWGFEDVLSYDDILWGDWAERIQNWGFKDGHPIHLDGGTFGGVKMIDDYRNKRGLNDQDFREIYRKSRVFKKEFGDVDGYTKFSKEKRESQFDQKKNDLPGRYIKFLEDRGLASHKILAALEREFKLDPTDAAQLYQDYLVNRNDYKDYNTNNILSFNQTEQQKYGVFDYIKDLFTTSGRMGDELYKMLEKKKGETVAKIDDVVRVAERVKDKIGDDKQMLELFDKALRGEPGSYPNLPLDLQADVRKLRTRIDSASMELKQALKDANALTPELANAIDEGMGNYLNRSYKLFSNFDKFWARRWWNKFVSKTEWGVDDVPQAVLNKAKTLYYERANADLRNAIDLVEKMRDAQKSDMEILDALSSRFNINRTEAEKWIELPNKSSKEIFDMAYSRANTKVYEVFQDAAVDATTNPSKIAATFVETLRKRSDIPEEIRDLMGEYKNPIFNAVSTMYKLAHLVESTKLMNQIRDNGMGKWVFQEYSEGRDKVGALIQIPMNSKDMAPLAGLWISPYMYEVLRGGKENKGNAFIEGYLKLQSFVKWNKTIGSAATHGKNVIGNLGFVIGNGHYSPANWTETYRILRDASGKKEQYDAIMHTLNRHGVIGSNYTIGEIKYLMGGGDIDRVMMNLDKRRNKDTIEKIVDFAEMMYAKEDDMFKINSFLIERKRYAQALYDKPFSELDMVQQEHINSVAAEITKNVYPTFPRALKISKEMTKVPLLGNFLGFQFEAYRTHAKTLALALAELKNPKTKSIGASRLSGTLLLSTLRSAAVAWAGNMVGAGFMGVLGAMKDDDDEKQKQNSIRRYIRSYSKNSDLIVTKLGDGELVYYDLTASDPHGGVQRMINAYLTSKDPIKGIGSVVMEGVSPYIEPEITTDVIVRSLINEDVNKEKIWNPEDPNSLSQFMDWFNFTRKVMQPGTINTVERTVKAGKQADENKGLAMLEEAGMAFFGTRPLRIDVRRSFANKLHNKNDGYITRLMNARDVFARVYRDNHYKPTTEQVEAAKRKGIESVTNVLSDLLEDFNAAQDLGVPQEELLQKIQEGGFPWVKEIQAGLLQNDPSFLIDIMFDIEAIKKDSKMSLR